MTAAPAACASRPTHRNAAPSAIMGALCDPSGCATAPPMPAAIKADTAGARCVAKLPAKASVAGHHGAQHRTHAPRGARCCSSAAAHEGATRTSSARSSPNSATCVHAWYRHMRACMVPQAAQAALLHGRVGRRCSLAVGSAHQVWCVPRTMHRDFQTASGPFRSLLRCDAAGQSGQWSEPWGAAALDGRGWSVKCKSVNCTRMARSGR